MNEEVKKILTRIINTNHEAYIVGGAVRDYIIDNTKEIIDYDITTNLTLDEIKDLFKDYKMKLYSSKMTYLLYIDHLQIEITPYKGKNLKEDLYNRDYTINSIAMDINGNLIDYYNGIEDIKNKNIRMIDNELNRLKASPIRILRGIRLQALLNFNIDSKLFQVINDSAYLLNEINPLTIKKELDYILTVDKPSKYIRDYFNIFSTLFPGLKDCYKLDQRNTKWHHLDVLEHILSTVDNVGNDILIRYIALFHDIAKPKCMIIDENGIGHFYNHWTESAIICKENLLKYSYNKKFVDKVCLIINNHDFPLENESQLTKLKSLLKRNDNLRLYFEMRRADILSQNPINQDLRLQKLEELKKLCL